MEPVNETSDYYCKNCSASLMDTRPLYIEPTNSNTYRKNAFEQSPLWDQVEARVKRYLNSAGITDQSQINDLIHRVKIQAKPIMEKNNDDGLIQHAIQIAQGLLTDLFSAQIAHKTTPMEKPVSMKGQNIEFWSSHPKQYIQSLSAIIISLRTTFGRRR